jgi:hypothetical protein
VGHAKYPPLLLAIVTILVGTGSGSHIIIMRLNSLKTSETLDVLSSKVTLCGAFVGSGAVLLGVDIIIVGSAAPKVSCCDHLERVLRST